MVSGNIFDQPIIKCYGQSDVFETLAGIGKSIDLGELSLLIDRVKIK